jgi:hypothetical protein
MKPGSSLDNHQDERTLPASAGQATAVASIAHDQPGVSSPRQQQAIGAIRRIDGTVTEVEMHGFRGADTASLVSAVAQVLRLWDGLGLELGETAIVTGGHPYSRLAAVVARWYGALPVLYVTSDETHTPEGVEAVVVGEDPGAVLASLRSRLAARPAVAAAELSGRADIVDLLLETLPQFSRIMFAGDRAEQLTIDFYVNVHRKGLRLFSSVLDRLPDPPGGGDPVDRHAARARRLLDEPQRANECLSAINDEARRAGEPTV